MSDQSTQTQIKILLKEGKTSEAKKLINETIQNFALEDKGKLLAEYTAVYMQTINEINRRYNESLDTTIKDFKAIEKTEKKIDTLIHTADSK